eukprot:GEMP01044732.1.p1 GENE.GEMP01044732.1~~GEMP01044732.1.p1  ORF type:complete len:281 (+),score=65.07 GEMP01044732.1:244-1086(+)
MDLFTVKFYVRAEKTWMLPTALPAALHGAFTQQEWWCILAPINQVLNTAYKDYEEQTRWTRWLTCFRPGLNEDTVFQLQREVDKLLEKQKDDADFPKHARISSAFDAVPMCCNWGAHTGVALSCELTFELTPASFCYRAASRRHMLNHTMCEAAAVTGIRAPYHALVSATHGIDVKSIASVRSSGADSRTYAAGSVRHSALNPQLYSADSHIASPPGEERMSAVASIGNLDRRSERSDGGSARRWSDDGAPTGPPLRTSDKFRTARSTSRHVDERRAVAF